MSDLVISDIGTVVPPTTTVASGTLVRDIIERTESELLRGGGTNIPAWTFLSQAVGTGSTENIVLDARSQVAPDTVLEFDDDSMELVLTRTTSGTTVVPQVRGYLESTIAAHAAGTRVLLDNPWPKIVLFNALKSLLGSLYGYGLYRKMFSTDKKFTTNAPIDLPTGAKDTLSEIWVKHSTRYQRLRKGSEFEVLHLPTGPKIQLWWGGYTGSALTIPYKAEYGAVTSLDDNLTTLGVPESLQRELPLGIAARVLTGKEIPEAVAEHIRRQLANQGQQPGTRLSVASALQRQFEKAIVLEKVRLGESSPPAILYY